MEKAKVELSGEVGLRADLIYVCASRIWSEAAAMGRLEGLMFERAVEMCVADAMALGAGVDRAVADLRRAKEGVRE